MDKLDKFQAEAEQDASVDEVTIHEKQMMLPAIKHKWVARLVREKMALKHFEAERKAAVETVIRELKSRGRVDLSNTALENAAQRHESVQLFTSKIDETKLLIDYLERLEKIFSSMTWDYRNMVELIKMETM